MTAGADDRSGEAHFRALFESTAVGIALVDLHGQAMEANAALHEMLGYPPGALRGVGRQQVLAPEEEGRDREVFARLASGEQDHAVVEGLFLRRDGTSLHASVQLSLVRDAGAGPHSVVAAVSDVGAQRAAEAALRESEARHRRLADLAQEGLWEVDRRWRTTYVNARMATMLGYAPEEMVGRLSWDFMDDEGVALAVGNVQAWRGEVAMQQEFKFTDRQGRVVWALCSTALVFEGARGN